MSLSAPDGATRDTDRKCLCCPLEVPAEEVVLDEHVAHALAQHVPLAVGPRAARQLPVRGQAEGELRQHSTTHSNTTPRACGTKRSGARAGVHTAGRSYSYGTRTRSVQREWRSVQSPHGNAQKGVSLLNSESRFSSGAGGRCLTFSGPDFCDFENFRRFVCSSQNLELCGRTSEAGRARFRGRRFQGF